MSRFIVVAYNTGRKTYAIQALIDGKERRRKIGEHGAFTPEEARAKAKKLLAMIDNGVDPFAPIVPSTVPTFNDLADAYLSDVVNKKREESTRKTYLSQLRFLRPAIGDLPVTKLTTMRVIELHNSRSASPGASNRGLNIISAIWNHAKKTRGEEMREIFRYNPVEFVEKYPEQQVTRFLSLAEMKRFGEALQRAERGELRFEVDESGPKAKHAPRPENRRIRIDPFAIAALRLLLLTGARRNEIVKARWDWVNWDAGIIVLPKSKSGRVPKPIVLSDYALSILASLPRVNDFIIAGKIANKPRHDLRKPWASILKAAKIENITLHGLRHSFASAAARKKMGLPMIGALLGHTQVQTTKRYAHLDLEPMKGAVEAINADMAIALGPRNETSPRAGVAGISEVGKIATPHTRLVHLSARSKGST